MFSKKINFTTLLLVLLYCIMPIITILMIQHISMTDTLSKMENGTFGESSNAYEIKNKNPIKSIIKSCKNQSTDIAVFCDSTDISEKIRYIYFNNHYVDFPMKEGRFFKSSDFKPNNKVCVIGKNQKKNSFKEGNQRYILYNDSKYKVLGILGYEDETLFDSYIFLNMSSEKIDSNIFTFDFLKTNFNTKSIHSRETELLSTLKSNNLNPKTFAGETKFSESIIPKIYSAKWLALLIAGCFICILLTTTRWIEQKKKVIGISRIYGARKTDILGNIFLHYLCIILLSFFVGGLYCHIIYPSYFTSFIQGFLNCVGFIFIILFYSTFKLLKAPLEEVMIV
ncbi:MacB-like core domain-containing protein [Lachnospiraceae bacterium C7]|nr:MacB-like core domain-containing protein [Lachnospiraceae bacterium C7]